MKKIDLIRKIPYTVICIIILISFWIFKFIFADGKVNDIPLPGQNSDMTEVGENPSEADISKDTDNSSENGSSENGNFSEDTNDSGTFTGDAKTDESEDSNADNNTDNNADNQAGDLSVSGEEKLSEFYDWEYDEEGYPFCMGTLEDGFICYEPSAVNSKYYSDGGKIALTSFAEYVRVEDDYFDDACFIGDSRMVGIYDYAGWDNADFYCDNGFCLNSYVGGGKVKCHTDNKSYTLEDAMHKKTYSKIYIMLGINDCGYGTTEIFEQRYKQMIAMIRAYQPDAVIFLMANLHIATEAEKKDKTGVYTNVNVNAKNAAIAECADPSDKIYYLDYNSLFCDENGYLRSESTFDGFHLYAQYYMEWTDYFRSHGIMN